MWTMRAMGSPRSFRCSVPASRRVSSVAVGGRLGAQPSLLALDVERAYDFAPAGHFTGHIAGESRGVRVERLGGIVFGELAHLRFFEKRARLAIDAGRDIGRKLLRARQAEP